MQNLEKEYEGLVFDLDGTLADTMPTHFVAWVQTLERYGITLSEERFYALGGVPAELIIEMLGKEQCKEVDPVLVAEEKELLFIELIGTVQPVEPVLAIAEAHRGQLPMAIATGSPVWLAEKMLKALNIFDWFGAVVGAEMVENPKPAPDTFELAAKLIKVDPKRCHAFEDTKLGIEAATQAGMKVLDVTTL